MERATKGMEESRTKRGMEERGGMRLRETMLPDTLADMMMAGIAQNMLAHRAFL